MFCKFADFRNLILCLPVYFVSSQSQLKISKFFYALEDRGLFVFKNFENLKN